MHNGTLIKCTKQGGRSVHSFRDAEGHTNWDLPKKGNPGAWKRAANDEVLRPHHNGLHLAKEDCLIDWLTGYHYRAETEGETVEGVDCVVARKARLTESLPVNALAVSRLCKSWLEVVPRILDALTVYPNMTADVWECVDVIRKAPLKQADRGLSGLQAYKYVTSSAMRLSYDAHHSIEYNRCTVASRTCMEAIVGVFNTAASGSRVIDHAKFVSHQIATAMDALFQNYLYMKGLCDQGYDHQDEVRSMERFLTEQDFSPHDYTSSSDIAGFFASVRKKQNREILPALGLGAS